MSVSFLLVTANVGSLFDENDSIEPFWESAFFELIEKTSPDFLALHLQEIGGKEYEKHMRKVSQFIEKLYRNISARFHLYDGFSFADEDVQTADKFTALGCLYLVNRSIGDHLHVWNFHTSVYEKVSGFILFDHCDKARFVRRIKFPIHLFPNFKWTRKGYTKTRWKLFGKELQLVNIHLFHDACNLTAMQESPSVYSNSRREAFNHALAELRSENFNNHAGFIFGDFNFRLDGKELLRRLATGADSTELVNSTNGQTLSLCRRIADTEEELLTIGTKKFDHLNGNHLSHELLEQFNKEARQFPQLFECEIKFAPSYPYCEDVALPTTLMKTRAPAWCDRVLMNSIAWDLISKSSDVQYDSTGLTVCTGDHKFICISRHRYPYGKQLIPPPNHRVCQKGKIFELLAGDMDFSLFGRETLVGILKRLWYERIVPEQQPTIFVYHSRVLVLSNRRLPGSQQLPAATSGNLYVTVIKLDDLAVFIQDGRSYSLKPPWLKSKSPLDLLISSSFHLRFRTNEVHRKVFGDVSSPRSGEDRITEDVATVLQRRFSQSSFGLPTTKDFHLRFPVGSRNVSRSSSIVSSTGRQTPNQPSRSNSREEYFSEAAAAGAQYITVRDEFGQPEAVYLKKTWLSTWERQQSTGHVTPGPSERLLKAKKKQPAKGVQTDPGRTGDPHNLGSEKLAKKRLKSFGYSESEEPLVVREGVEVETRSKQSRRPIHF